MVEIRARCLFIAANEKSYSPRDREHILSILRSFFIAPNVRIGSKHVEIEAWDPDLSRAIEAIEKNIGRIIEWKLIEEPEIPGAGGEQLIERYVDLFNQERFWEAHGALEALWRISRDKDAQGLILVAAAFIKIQENRLPEFIALAKKALEMLGDGKYHCIDLADVRRKLFASLENKSPFKIRCVGEGTNSSISL